MSLHFLTHARVFVLGALSFAGIALAVACTSETTTPSGVTADSGAPQPEDEERETETETETKPVKDAGRDVAVEAAKPGWQSGESGKSCADACKKAGKTCVAACTDHRSCGGHDDKPPPYAGYACYYEESGGNGSSFRVNEGRSLLTCDEVATLTWENFGSEMTLGDYLGNNPVSCCCQ